MINPVRKIHAIRTPRIARAIIAASLGGAGMFATSASATTPPTTAPSGIIMGQGAQTPDQMTVNKLINEIGKINVKLRTTTLPEQAFHDPAKRTAAAAEAIPALKKVIENIDRISVLAPKMGAILTAQKLRYQALLATMGDKPAIDQLQAMATSNDPQESLRGKGGQMLVRWYSANADPTAEAVVVDAVEKLDRENPTNQDLTYATRDMGMSASTPQLADRLLSIATDVMTSPEAVMLKKKLARKKFLAEQAPQQELHLEQLVDKPVTIAGTQPDGTIFSTGDLRGKVILVDFWATWCGPCKAELPRVKEMYEKYHSQGLEVVGVSNDFNVEKLKSYIADNKMPWPELVDSKAAAASTWNPISTRFGINAIPVMCLIDKKGVVRSVTARKDMETMIPKLLAETPVP